jgi:hypothetical protein
MAGIFFFFATHPTHPTVLGFTLPVHYHRYGVPELHYTTHPPSFRSQKKRKALISAYGGRFPLFQTAPFGRVFRSVPFFHTSAIAPGMLQDGLTPFHGLPSLHAL